MDVKFKDAKASAYGFIGYSNITLILSDYNGLNLYSICLERVIVEVSALNHFPTKYDNVLTRLITYLETSYLDQWDRKR